MSKKNFSAVTAETGAPADDTNTTSADRAGTGSRRRPVQKVALAAAGLVVIIALIWAVAVSCGSGGHDDTASPDATHKGIGSAHGPNSIIAGIPTGYTRDKPGAATAAVNFTQAVSQARQGQIEGAKLKETSVGSGASEALLQVLGVGTERAEDSGVFNSAPVVVTVPQFSTDTAVVSVWAVGASQSKVNDTGKVGVLTLWTTTTVTLQWIDDDWKATDWQFQSGPNPDDATFPQADSALSQTAISGYYSFYIN